MDGGDWGGRYPTVLVKNGCPRIRSSSWRTVVQSGKARSLPLGPLLSRISAAQDKRMGDRDVAARPCLAKAVACDDMKYTQLASTHKD